MSDLGSLLEREMQEIRPPEYTIGDVTRRRDRRRRNQRIATVVVAVLLAGVAVGGVLRAFGDLGSAVPAEPIPGRNGRIAFVSPGAAGPEDRLYTVAPDGSGLRRVTDIHVESPDWSPDGSMIAFDDGSVVDHIDWSFDVGHIHTVKADGTGLSQVTMGEGAEFAPDWSPDGTHIAVSAIPASGAPPGIFITDAVTGTMRALTANPYPGYQDKEPDYAPDGTRIAFVRDRRLVDAGAASGNESALFVVNVDGTGLHRLTPWRMGLAGTPSWSPDGSSIVFRSGSAFDASGAPAQIFSIRPDGRGLRQLTSATDASSYWPAWSPDGRRIVFTRYAFGAASQQLFTMSPDGSHVAPIPVLGGNEATWGMHP
jgi:Tol biopolymer transport system component